MSEPKPLPKIKDLDAEELKAMKKSVAEAKKRKLLRELT